LPESQVFRFFQYCRRLLAKKGGLGLVSIEERLRMVNGMLTIDSKPGRGTKVLVDVPVSQQKT